MDEAIKWNRRFLRERTARGEAERLLEEKSLSLYNKALELDKTIAARTRALEDVSAEAQLLSDAISRTLNGVIITNKHNRVIWANPAFTSISGYEVEELLGKIPGEILQGPKTCKETRAYMRGKIEMREAFEAEILNYSKQGKPYWISSQATPVFDDNGEFKYFIAIESDITESRETRHKLEHEMKRANEMAQRAREANSAKTRFLATMSHELRTPLNGILGYAQILENKTNIDEKSLSHIKVMRHSGEHLLSLINDLLDMPKIEAGNHKLTVSRFDLESMLNSVIEIIHSKAVDKGLQLKLQVETNGIVPEEHRARINADSRAIRQTLINLLGNAIKFTDTGTVSLDVQLLEYDGKKATIEFTIVDTGRGIPDEKLAKLFDAFTQVDEERDLIQGSGLGLFIAKRLVQQMGDDIHVKSTLDVGSCFSFKIRCPMDFIAESKIEDARTEEQTKKFPESYTGHKRSILIVDDITANRQLLVDLLAPMGFKLEEAENGRDALKKIKSNHYDLTLSDVIMPYMSGYELIKILRADPELSNNCVIAISASIMQISKREKTQIKQFDGFVAKPVQTDELLDMMREKLQLEWIYPEDSNKDSSPAQGSTPTGDSLVEKLHWFARIGDIKALRQEKSKLQATFPDSFQEIERLLEDFRPQKVAELLENKPVK
ncbi:MAG: PAS domain S-box-containing protein [Zhongshania aliphaticivorans]|jgi:PAS domain S-box-containing protein